MPVQIPQVAYVEEIEVLVIRVIPQAAELAVIPNNDAYALHFAFLFSRGSRPTRRVSSRLIRALFFSVAV